MSFFTSEQMLNRKNARRGFSIFEDFIASLGSLVGAATGSGASSGISSGYSDVTGRRPGALVLSTGTTATGNSRCGVTSGGSITNILLGAGTWYNSVGVQLPILSTDTENFVFMSGLSDSVTSALPADGAFFRYSHSEANGNWQIITSSNSIRTTINTNIPVVANTWYDLEILVNQAFDVVFSINGTSFTISTNLPTGTGRQLTYVSTVSKTAGVTNRTVFIDYVHLAWDIPEGR